MSWRSPNNVEWEEGQRLRDLFLGHTVTKVADDTLHLDDGRVLRVVPNEGGCSCGAGDYELKALKDCPVNAIMDVQVVVDAREDDYAFEDGKTYRLFVLAQDERIELATIAGDDGNGYYGTGFWIEVQHAAEG